MRPAHCLQRTFANQKIAQRSLRTAAAFANVKNACTNPPHEAYEPRPGFANPARLAEPLANQSGRRELKRIGLYCPCNNSTDPLHFALIYYMLYFILYSVYNISLYIHAYSCHVIILDDQKGLFCEAFTKTFANHF